MPPAGRLRAGAVKTIKVGSVHKRGGTSLGFKQAPEAAVLSFSRVPAGRPAAVHADVVLPAAVHHGQRQEELRGPEGSHAEDVPQLDVVGQRDFQQGVEAVGLALLHQDAHAEGLVPLGLLPAASPGLGSGGEDVGERGRLRAAVPQGVGWSQSP